MVIHCAIRPVPIQEIGENSVLNQVKTFYLICDLKTNIGDLLFLLYDFDMNKQTFKVLHLEA